MLGSEPPCEDHGERIVDPLPDRQPVAWASLRNRFGDETASCGRDWADASGKLVRTGLSEFCGRFAHLRLVASGVVH